MKTTIINDKWHWAFAIFALLYLSLIPFSPIPFQFAVKTLPISILLLMVVCSNVKQPTKLLLTLAVIASGSGDVFLAIDLSNSFIFGLGSFLIAHLLYTAIFYQSFDRQKVLKEKFVLAGLLVFATTMAMVLLPVTGELKIPVIIYLTVITLMAICARLTALSAKVGIGALSFVVSDALLAQSMFLTPLPLSSIGVMLTYYLAQYLIVTGVLESQSMYDSLNETNTREDKTATLQ